MQTIIDFLVNNYLWFIIIALILVFALIGYLVDTNERVNKKSIEEDSLESPIEKSIRITEPIENINMNMGTEEIQELDKDVIEISQNSVENSIPSIENNQNKPESTEVLDID